MNKQIKQQLETVITSLINDEPKAAQTALHDYLRTKSQAILGEEGDMEDIEGGAPHGEDHEGDDLEGGDHGDHEGDDDHEGDEECPECGETPCVCDDGDDDADDHGDHEGGEDDLEGMGDLDDHAPRDKE